MNEEEPGSKRRRKSRWKEEKKKENKRERLINIHTVLEGPWAYSRHSCISCFHVYLC